MQNRILYDLEERNRITGEDLFQSSYRLKMFVTDRESFSYINKRRVQLVKCEKQQFSRYAHFTCDYQILKLEHLVVCVCVCVCVFGGGGVFQ